MQILTHIETLVRKIIFTDAYRHCVTVLAFLSALEFVFRAFHSAPVYSIVIMFFTASFWVNEVAEAYRYRAFLQKYQ